MPGRASGSTPVPQVANADRSSEIDAEAWVLATEPGQNLLAEVARVPAPGPADVARFRQRAPACAVAAAIRLAACRWPGEDEVHSRRPDVA